MQIPILNGIITDQNGDFIKSYPKNYMPISGANGISNGYLKPNYGIVQFGTGPGFNRGGIKWNGAYYRVMGTKLIKIDSFGAYVVIGDVGGSGQVDLFYGFGYLAIVSSLKLYIYDGVALTQVTDSNLGNVLSATWIDSYVITTDGDSLIASLSGQPTSYSVNRFLGSDIDPDPIIGVFNLRNELYALNRNTIELFDNLGGSGFPFQRIEGAQIQKGVIGSKAFCEYIEHMAFLGSGRNEDLGVYIARSGTAQKLSTREIDIIINSYTESQLQDVVVESKVQDDQNHLMIHLPDQTLIYDAVASARIQDPVWFIAHSGLTSVSQYRAKNFVKVYDKWHCADPTSNKYGYLVEDISSHYGDRVSWEFGTKILYNQSKGAIIHQLELDAQTGNVALGDNPTISTQYSLDGRTWSMNKFINVGTIGDRVKRLVWIKQGNMKKWRMQRFTGLSDAHLSISRLEAEIEPLYV